MCACSVCVCACVRAARMRVLECEDSGSVCVHVCA